MQQIKRAFTLFELILVIIIIGAVYLLFLSGFDTKKKEIRDFAKLKEIVLHKSKGETAKLICSGEKCETCIIYLRDSQIELEYQLFNSKPKIFDYDRYGYLFEKEYDDEICFEYKIYKNKSSDNMLVEKNGKYYIFYSFAQKSDLFTDYDLAVQKYNPSNTLPTANNEYYSGKK